MADHLETLSCEDLENLLMHVGRQTENNLRMAGFGYRIGIIISKDNYRRFIEEVFAGRSRFVYPTHIQQFQGRDDGFEFMNWKVIWSPAIKGNEMFPYLIES